MNRLEAVLTAARTSGKKALLPFLTGEYPDRETFLGLLFAVQEAGADAVEVGIPFSDPSADGPTIEAASHAALAGGATVRGIMETVARARRGGLTIPLLYMTYYNPVLAFGPKKFAEAAVQSGADGVLVVDLPPEEAKEFLPDAAKAGLATVMLVAPTTPGERVPTVLAFASGFVYCVSVTGVTGVKRPVTETVGELVGRVRPHTKLPILVGFGVGDPQSAAAMAGVSDGVIIGSALTVAIGDRRGAEAARAAREFLGGIRAAL